MTVNKSRRTVGQWHLQLHRYLLIGARAAEGRVRRLRASWRHNPSRDLEIDDPEIAQMGPLTRDYLHRLFRSVESRVAEEGEDARDRIFADLAERHGDDLEPRAAKVTAGLLADAGRLTRSLDRDKKILALTLQQVWGDAFQAYEAVSYASYELGAEWAASRRAGQRPAVWNTLLDLHARACRVASEIQKLHRAGFATGAEARARSLHELAVVASVLQKSDAELTDRYRAYEAIEQYDDAVHYNEMCELLEQTPLSADRMAELKERYDDVTARWADIQKSSGWARSLFKNPTFRALEEYADLGHLYPFYRLGNHSVHAGPHASTMNYIEIGGSLHRSPGSTVHADFAETAHAALISLQQINGALLVERVAAEIDVDSLVGVMAIAGLIEVAGDRFEAAVGVAAEKGWVY